jgi:hypothetical protein
MSNEVLAANILAVPATTGPQGCPGWLLGCMVNTTCDQSPLVPIDRVVPTILAEQYVLHGAAEPIGCFSRSDRGVEYISTLYRDKNSGHTIVIREGRDDIPYHQSWRPDLAFAPWAEIYAPGSLRFYREPQRRGGRSLMPIRGITAATGCYPCEGGYRGPIWEGGSSW